MKLYRIRAVARKEVLHIVRDPRSLGMAVAIPMLLLILFGYALTLDVDHVPLIVRDGSGTPESRDLISRFGGSPYFDIRGYAANYPEAENALDSGRALAALVIPPDFADRLAAGEAAPAQLLADGSDANTAGIALSYARAVALGFPGQIANPPVELRPRVWYNPDMESRTYIIPGLIAVIMMAIAALLTSLTIAREWERGTMEQLISTPVRVTELILGKLLPYFAIGLLDMLIAVGMAEFLFHIPLRGSFSLLAALSALFLAGALSLGILISILTRSQLLASQLAMVLTFLPSFLLSGFMFAIGSMPKPLQLFTHLIPARYFVSILKGIYLKGIGMNILGLQVLFLALFGALVLAVGIKTLKKKVPA